jgi:hypothetical protein
MIVRKSMHTFPADFHRLTLLIQRILDADVVCEAEGTVLLTATDAAERSLEAGNVEAARRYDAQVMRFTEALVCNDKLAPTEGRAVLETARRLLI